MLHKLIRLVLVTLFISVAGARANPFLHVDCSYEGDGWFKYKVRMPVDPFWEEAYVGTIDFSAFGPVEQVEAPAEWPHGNSLYFSYDAAGGQVRPVEYVFRLKSPYRHFKRVSNQMLLTMSLVPQLWYAPTGPIFSRNIVGFVNLDMIVPSPVSVENEPVLPHTISLSIVPDVRIENVIMQGDKAEGITFAAPTEALYQIEGSDNLSDWTVLLSGQGSGGTNTVISPSISSGGPFYRVMLTGFSNLFSGGILETEPNTDGINNVIEGVQFKKEQDGFKVVFPSKVSAQYQVEFLDAGCKVLKTVKHLATSDMSSVPVPVELGSATILVRVSLSSSATE